jgi:hypothetical protein
MLPPVSEPSCSNAASEREICRFTYLRRSHPQNSSSLNRISERLDRRCQNALPTTDATSASTTARPMHAHRFMTTPLAYRADTIAAGRIVTNTFAITTHQAFALIVHPHS